MPARFSMLASGSSGNCAFLKTDGFGLLIDVGLPPRLIAARLAAVGASWNDVQAVVLTHTHTDHWKDVTFAEMRRRRVPLYCAPGHHTALTRYGGYFDQMLAANLVRPVEAGVALELSPGVTCRPIEVPHDSDPTFAYRLDGPPGLFAPQWSLGYASDLGVARPDLIEAFVDVSALAIEFNHCERMEQMSGRPAFLVRRVLGEHGHLSNAQAAAAVQSIVRASAPGSLKHLVQLHLSRDCNKPTLAAQVGLAALAETGSSAQVTTATQERVTRPLDLEGTPLPRPTAPALQIVPVMPF
ncbi:MAG TPA: MBL fold metallo-hydrolase [Gemmataceae bacterium]|jgi:phosphoribosyl 1,2-cyclic phosphodiesterase|nr:MBL fold metallo-hydrolase [Gemmataceae bacterium]